VMTGDQTLFVRGDETENAWKVYSPFLGKHPKLYSYQAGSWGPDKARTLGSI
jgi:glucose-6-phosphate 1-dehydrogenase